ncbi:MAG: DUF3267 domain-containing protein [Bacteroidales bacterium]|nr:DUF3267 domain-containing protein [Bacteroidales bacterium]
MVEDNLYVNGKEVVIGELVVMKFASRFFLIYTLLLFLPFVLIYPQANYREGLTFLWHLLFWIIPIIIFHEGLHALVWVMLTLRWRDIKFGFHRQYLTFYTHCSVPLSKFVYFAGGIAPFIILSVLPTVYAFYNISFYWLSFAIFNAWTCAADLLMCYYILRLPKKSYILDHPKKLGYFVYRIQQKS